MLPGTSASYAEPHPFPAASSDIRPVDCIFHVPSSDRVQALSSEAVPPDLSVTDCGLLSIGPAEGLR